jgi:uncharacterized protein YciI
MLFHFHLVDRPDAGDLRQRLRPEHRAYLATMADRMAFAGPLLTDDGQTMIGSVLVIEFGSRAAAERWLADEPFTRAGLYGRREITVFSNLWPQKVGFPPE